MHGGLINIGIRIGFDSRGKILIGYHKYDKAGNTQLFLTRFEDGNWVSRQVTSWTYRWNFKGYGTIVNELLIESPKPASKKKLLVFGFHHIQYGDGQVLVKQKNLDPVAVKPLETPYPGALDNVRSAFPGMVVNKVFDAGKPSEGEKYLLRWETLVPNHDRQRQENLPPYTMLEVFAY